MSKKKLYYLNFFLYRKRKLYLPYCNEGWYDYYNMKFIAKQGNVELEAPLDKLPILMKGGTIIPRAETPWHPSPHSAPIKEIVIYPALDKGENLQSNLPIIFDDGETLQSAADLLNVYLNIVYF